MPVTFDHDSIALLEHQARIDGDKVIVASSEVSQPQFVRYDWANDPDGNLFNGAGLPASPFRTDQD